MEGNKIDGVLPTLNKEKLRADIPELTLKEKIQLDKHKLTSKLAIVIVLVYLSAVVIQAWKGNLDIIQELRTLVLIIIGYYFGRGSSDGD